MRTVGLITEYNPFHNGHLYHLRESLCVTESEVSVAVMSGHFLQRGEPALIDKWRRAEMARAAGVDVIIELPLPWACSSAPDFARGAVQALNALGGITTLCFGSELGTIDPLQHCADFLCDQEIAVMEKTSKLLRQGINYPLARSKILAELFSQELDSAELTASNNILGIEYLKALRQTKSSIRPLTIRRIGAGYHDASVGQDGIASATGIRKKLTEGQSIDGLIPSAALLLLKQALTAEHFFAVERYFLLLQAQIFRNPSALKNCWLVENGIENRLLAIAEKSFDLQEMISGIKSRQLTRTRIQRMLVSVLLGFEKKLVQKFLAAGPRYLHLLAVSQKGRDFLSHTRKQREIPLIQNFSGVRINNPHTNYFWNLLNSLD